MEEHFGLAPDNTNEGNDRGKSPSHIRFKKKFPRDPEKKNALRKEMRKKKHERKCRLIIRNLSFKVDEKDLTKVFSAFGKVVDVSIPKSPDGKMRGFGFVQYERFQSAIEAVRSLNYKVYKGRPVAIDYAVAKDKYQHITSSKYTANNLGKEASAIQVEEEKVHEEKEDSEEEKEDSEEESSSDSENKNSGASVSDAEDDDHVKKFLKEFDADRESVQDEDEPDERESTSGSSSESDDDSKDLKKVEDDSEDDDDDDNDDDDTEISNSKRKKAQANNQEHKYKRKNLSHDVNEGKTVFIRNVSFDTNEDDLKKTMEVFGPVTYCLLCIDKFTELPRGTAFAKFENKEDADKVIEKGTDSDPEGIFLDGRKLYCSVALSHEELQSRAESGAKTGKDKRNLYLLKVGVIKSGSEEAQGVSQSDIAKRNQLEMLKKNKLKNLQFFVSDKRLCVHNIPSYYSDTQLQKLFKNAAGPGAKVTEARIMRNLKKVNPQGISESKGFGFVCFEKHEHALKTLKEINNNPEIFTPQKRPIVEFAVENMNALLTKERRKEKSRMKITREAENAKSNHREEDDFTTLKFNKKGSNNKRGGKAGAERMMYNDRNSDKQNNQKKFGSSKGKMENKFNRQRNQQFKGRGGNFNNRNVPPANERLPKKKMENNFNKQRNPQFRGRGGHINNNMSPANDRSPKKKNKKQKNRTSSQDVDSRHFNQMVTNYKQKLLSKME